MKYYIMVGEGVHPVHPIHKSPRLPGGPWYHGQKLGITFDLPLQYELASDHPDAVIKMLYCNKAIPVMHNSMVEALQTAGVDNLELFPAAITNPDTAQVHHDYQAFNVVGLIAAADLEKSIINYPKNSTPHLDGFFEELHINEAKTGDLHLFRLEESCDAICVSEAVKEAIEARGIPGIIFYESGEWSG